MYKGDKGLVWMMPETYKVHTLLIASTGLGLLKCVYVYAVWASVAVSCHVKSMHLIGTEYQ
jgi:hypothetical protein